MIINLGYCCVSMLHKDLKCSRASTKTYLEKHSREFCHDYLIQKSRENLSDLQKLIAFNAAEDIFAYRIPEQILPQLDLGYYTVSEVRDELEQAGETANQFQMQLSTHPSQYFVLNSLREDVVNRTIFSLDLIAEVLEAMGLEKIPNLTLHLGMKNGYETIGEAIGVFCKNYKRLSETARKYLVLENDHVSFNVENCMMVHEEIGIPIVFDNKHYEWNPGKLTYDEAMRQAVGTWSEKSDRIPKLHLSSDKPGKKHAHDEYVEPEDYLKMEVSLVQTNIRECNVMLECKKKDEAVRKLRKKLAKMQK